MNRKFFLLIVPILFLSLSGCGAHNRVSIYEITENDGKVTSTDIFSHDLDASGDTLTIFEANADPAKYKTISASSSNQTLLNNIRQSVVQAAQLAKIFLTTP